MSEARSAAERSTSCTGDAYYSPSGPGRAPSSGSDIGVVSGARLNLVRSASGGSVATANSHHAEELGSSHHLSYQQHLSLNHSSALAHRASSSPGSPRSRISTATQAPRLPWAQPEARRVSPLESGTVPTAPSVPGPEAVSSGTPNGVQSIPAPVPASAPIPTPAPAPAPAPAPGVMRMSPKEPLWRASSVPPPPPPAVLTQANLAEVEVAAVATVAGGVGGGGGGGAGVLPNPAASSCSSRPSAPPPSAGSFLEQQEALYEAFAAGRSTREVYTTQVRELERRRESFPVGGGGGGGGGGSVTRTIVAEQKVNHPAPCTTPPRAPYRAPEPQGAWQPEETGASMLRMSPNTTSPEHAHIASPEGARMLPHHTSSKAYCAPYPPGGAGSGGAARHPPIYSNGVHSQGGGAPRQPPVLGYNVGDVQNQGGGGGRQSPTMGYEGDMQKQGGGGVPRQPPVLAGYTNNVSALPQGGGASTLRSGHTGMITYSKTLGVPAAAGGTMLQSTADGALVRRASPPRVAGPGVGRASPPPPGDGNTSNMSNPGANNHSISYDHNTTTTHPHDSTLTPIYAMGRRFVPRHGAHGVHSAPGAAPGQRQSGGGGGGGNPTGRCSPIPGGGGGGVRQSPTVGYEDVQNQGGGAPRQPPVVGYNNVQDVSQGGGGGRQSPTMGYEGDVQNQGGGGYPRQPPVLAGYTNSGGVDVSTTFQQQGDVQGQGGGGGGTFNAQGAGGRGYGRSRSPPPPERGSGGGAGGVGGEQYGSAAVGDTVSVRRDGPLLPPTPMGMAWQSAARKLFTSVCWGGFSLYFVGNEIQTPTFSPPGTNLISVAKRGSF